MIRTTIVTVAAALSTLAPNVAMAADAVDTTPPTAPFIVYAQGYYCLQLIVGVTRSTDDVTPQSALRYEVYADGESLGSLTDLGNESGVWGVLALKKTGPNLVTVEVSDAAGNRSRSNADIVTGYRC
jgi:hypothetical protein